MTDFDHFKNLIINSNINLLLLSLIFIFFMTIIQAIRFSIVLNYYKLRINIFNSWKNIALGILYNQVLPSTIGGDSIRFLNMKELNFDTKDSVKSILIDRVYGLVSLCLICGIGSIFLFSIYHKEFFFKTTQVITFTSVGLFFFYPLMFRKFIYKIFKKIKAFKLLDQIYFSFDSIIFFKVFFLSMAVYVFLSAAGFVILQALNINLDLWPFTWLFLSSLLIATIPISIGGWGFRESIFILSMGIIGIDNETAIAISFIYALQTSIIGIIGGSLWFLRILKRN